MSHIIVVYESVTGHAEAMAEAVARGVEEAGLSTRIIPAERVTNDDLLAASGIIVGSYTSYGIVAGGTKTLFDRSAAIHGKLKGKVGGAFATSGGFGGGTELTLVSILQMLLVHGMIVPGNSDGPHFGAVAIGAPGKAEIEGCRRLGRRIAELATKLGA